MKASPTSFAGSFCVWLFALVTFFCLLRTQSIANDANVLGFDPYVTISGYSDIGYRKTQFFEPEHHAIVGQIDLRLEGWLPPFRTNLSWGPYIRFAAIEASEDPAWENALLASPGLGFQAYPFSSSYFRETDSTLGQILGPLRLFGEYNRIHYWGDSNRWRPDEQVRIGTEYWRSYHVNDPKKSWWAEIWSGFWWQSANEFDQDFDSWIVASAVRGGVRVSEAGALSAITPYLAVESSFTDNPDYYWENRLAVGVGVRFAPSLRNLPERYGWLNRFIIYAEYLRAAAYYRAGAPAAVPDYDVRVGISFAIGEWFR